MDPQVERFFRLDDKVIRSSYRSAITLRNADLKSQVLLETIVRGLIPHPIDSMYDQTIRYITMRDCCLTDDSFSTMLNLIHESE